MLDVVFLAMFAVTPVLLFSVWLVKSRRDYRLHKIIQLTLAAVLLATVSLFEIDIRLHGWRERAEASPYYGGDGATPWVNYLLAVHLFFAVSTFVIWCGVVIGALGRFANPPAPGAHSRAHRRWGWIATLDMVMTSITGWTFYYLAFVAR